MGPNDASFFKFVLNADIRPRLECLVLRVVSITAILRLGLVYRREGEQSCCLPEWIERYRLNPKRKARKYTADGFPQ